MKYFLAKKILFAVGFLTLLSGCASIGPATITSDRSGYNVSVVESWKQQILLNIVKLRYVEPLFFMDIGDIVAAHSLETGASVGFSRSMFDVSTVTDSSSLDLGVSGRYTDRPTVTYRPLTGAAFRKGVIAPIPVSNLLLSLDSGISAKSLFTLNVRCINGLRNQDHLLGGDFAAVPSFQRVIEIFSRLQVLGAVHVTRHSLNNTGQEASLFLNLGGRHPTEETSELIRELQSLLELNPERREYAVVAGSLYMGKNIIALQTYSLMQMLAAVASRVSVPQCDLKAGRAIPGVTKTVGATLLDHIDVESSSNRPACAYSAVQFRKHWFWIDDQNLETKQVFTFIMMAFTLLEDDRITNTPLLTIPTQ